MSHALRIRQELARLDRNTGSPFARISGTHMARLVVMDDVVYVGMPACEDHLKSQYLVFESNFDGDLDAYLERMLKEAPKELEAVWGHCEGFPGTKDLSAFKEYMKQCQVPTTFFFAAVNNKTVGEMLRALQMKVAFADFVEENQGKSPADLQKSFAAFWEKLRTTPPPPPGSPGFNTKAKGVGQ
jgi:hypothetical protein